MPETGNRPVLDTAKTILLPAELYTDGVGGEYLRFNGLEAAADEVVVVSDVLELSGGGVVAVMAAPRELFGKASGGLGVDASGNSVPSGGAAGFVGARLPADPAPVSPLLELVAAAAKSKSQRTVNIWLSVANVYVVVWENGLRMAEVFPENSTDSLLYYMQVVGLNFNLRKFDIFVGGRNSALAANALREYFKGVKLADFALL